MPELGSIFVRIGADVKDFESGLNKASKALTHWGRDVTRLGRDISQVVGLPLAGVATAALKFSESASLSFKSFGESVRASFGALGDSIAKTVNLPTFLRKIAESVSDVVHAFTGLDPQLQRGILGFAAFAVVIGPALVILGKLTVAIGLLAAHPMFALLGLLAAGAVGFLAWKAGADSASTGASTFGETLEEVNKKIRKLNAEVYKGPGAFPEGSPMSAPIKEVTQAEFSGSSTGKNLRSDLAKDSREKGIKAVADIQDRVNIQLAEINTKEKLLGDRYDENAAKAEVFRKATTELGAAAELGNLAARDAVVGMNQELDDSTSKIGEGITAWGEFKNQMSQIPVLAVQIGQGIFEVFNTLSEGLGQAVAQVLVYGKNIGEVFKALGAQILATVISTLVKIGVQQLVLAVTSTGAAALIGSAYLGVSTARAGVAAYAAAIESEGLLGLATGIGFAADAILEAGAIAEIGAAAGHGFGIAAAAAEGGLTLGPTLLLAGEGGEQEMIAPLSEAERILGTGGRSQRISVYIGSRAVVDATVEGMPGELKLRGIY